MANASFRGNYLYSQLKENRLYTEEQLSDIVITQFGIKQQSAKKYIRELQKRDLLIKLKQGLYALSTTDLSDKKIKQYYVIQSVKKELCMLDTFIELRKVFEEAAITSSEFFNLDSKDLLLLEELNEIKRKVDSVLNTYEVLSNE